MKRKWASEMTIFIRKIPISEKIFKYCLSSALKLFTAKYLAFCYIFGERFNEINRMLDGLSEIEVNFTKKY